ncbi:MAG: hypothetical protein ACRD2E_02435 [Terriglobales bacterium]
MEAGAEATAGGGTPARRGEPLSQETLLQLFQALVDKNYSAIGLHDDALAGYVARVLAAFARPAALYAVCNEQGRRLHRLGEMLAASDPVHGGAGSFEREAAVRRQIGDFALFFTGMYPESLRGRRGDDRLLEFVAAGKESYQIVSAYEHTRAECEPPPEWAAVALPVAEERAPRGPLFAALASHFERCMYGLNLVKSEIASFGDPAYQAARELLM